MKITNINNTSFKAVDPKFLAAARAEHQIMNTVSGDLIEKLQFHILTKKISKQDGIDTIEALRPLTKKKYHNLLDSTLEMCKKILKV